MWVRLAAVRVTTHHLGCTPAFNPAAARVGFGYNWSEMVMKHEHASYVPPLSLCMVVSSLVGHFEVIAAPIGSRFGCSGSQVLLLHKLQIGIIKCQYTVLIRREGWMECSSGEEMNVVLGRRLKLRRMLCW